MIFVLPLFIVGGFVLAAVWFLFFRTAVRHESTVKAAKEREANFDRLLRTPNEALYCLDCRKVFRGPLDEDGCPHCNVKAFVIPACAHSDPSIGSACPEEKETLTPEVITVVPPAPDDTLQARQTQQTQRKK